MRCSSFCTASTYNISELQKSLEAEGFSPKLYDTVLHIQKKGKNANGDVFFFPYGCIVIWGLDAAEERKIINLVKGCESEVLATKIEDLATYVIGKKTYIHEENDQLHLGKNDVLIKLSFSFGLSQSVKLSAFEDSILRTIESTRHIPEELISKGKISLSRKKIAQQLGALFAERSSINLHTDILGTPEFFWRRPKHEPYYVMASNYLDITTRLDILNRRLDVIHELYGVLSYEINHIHSSRLELTIIYLIVIEVLLVIIKDFLKWI